MKFEIKSQWCAIVLEEEDCLVAELGRDNTVTGVHQQTHTFTREVYGPFATAKEADAWCKDFNKEHDGSPFYADIWQISLTTFTP
jgi:hypothetical protein